MALQGDGKIVAVGSGRRSGDFALARYNPTARSTRASPATASRRPTSGTSTRRTGWRSRPTARSSRSASAQRRDGNDFALARYNPNGSLDTSFSGDGKQTTDFGGFDEANGVALQADGKIVAVGARSLAASDDFALARYNPNGSLDTSFSGDGKQTTDFGGDDQAVGVALQGDGKIVVAGSASAPTSVANGDFALARYLGG